MRLPRPEAVLVALVPALLLGACSSVPGTDSPAPSTAPPTGVIVILADDLGSGDIAALWPGSAIPTPHLDALVHGGRAFTDAHSPSAVCTPTRYGLLTGRYAWRTSLKSGVLWGSSPALIEPERPTLAGVLSDAGYRTGAVGKWHLGLGAGESTDWSAPLSPGPVDVGFDTFLGIPASLDIPPYAWVRDDGLEAPLIERTGARRMARSGGSGFIRAGKMTEGFVHEDVLPRIGRESVAFLEAVAASGEDSTPPGATEPFFLYVPLTAPHTPWLPPDSDRGASGAGPYGDFVVTVDRTVGSILEALDRLDLADDTLVLFTSDNGAHWTPGDKQSFSHRANAGFRGQKADIWEGGHRVPFVVRWPGRVPAHTRDDTPITLVDVLPTVAALAGASVPDGAAEDGVDLSALLLATGPVERGPIVHHAIDGMFAIRDGRWKLIEARGSGGFSSPKRITPGEGEPEGQLYDLVADPGETTNRWSERPEIVARLTATLARLRRGD